MTTSPHTLESSSSVVPCSEVKTSPPFLSRSVETRQADSVIKSKDKAFIARLVSSLNELEAKYLKRRRESLRESRGLAPFFPESFSQSFRISQPQSLRWLFQTLTLKSGGLMLGSNLLSPTQSNAKSIPALKTLSFMWTGTVPHFNATLTSIIWLANMANHFGHVQVSKPALV